MVAASTNYPVPAQPYEVTLRPSHMDALIGKFIPRDEAARILESLEIEIVSREEDAWQLRVPRYRVDVTREADVIEEVMRIYGYNNIELSGYVHANLSPKGASDRSYSRRILLSEQLTGAGFNELLNNSLSSEAYYEGLTSCPADKLVQLVNPLSGELNVMRQTLLFGGSPLSVVTSAVSRRASTTMSGGIATLLLPKSSALPPRRWQATARRRPSASGSLVHVSRAAGHMLTSLLRPSS